MNKHASIKCNIDFIRISTISYGIHMCWDPKFHNLYFSIGENIALLGNALMIAINRSRDLSSNDDDYFLLSWTGQKDLYTEEIEKTVKKYNYKNKKQLLEYMQSCSVEINNKNIIMSPWKHCNLECYDGMDKKFDVIIPSNSLPEVVGAAVKYAIARCRGKGADLVAKKLFPDGVPETFEKYLELLDLSI